MKNPATNEDALYQAMIENGESYHRSEHYRQECLIPDPIVCKPEAIANGHYVAHCFECGWVGCTDTAKKVEFEHQLGEFFNLHCPVCGSEELEECEE